MYNYNTFYSRQLVESEMFPKTLSFFVFVGWFFLCFFLIDERVSKQDFR